MGSALAKGEPASVSVKVSNTDRTFGTIWALRSQDSIRKVCRKIPSQSTVMEQEDRVSAPLSPNGLTISLEGDTNDYYRKGLSGGKLVIYPPKKRNYSAKDNMIVGNVALYGATGGKVFINGVAATFCGKKLRSQRCCRRRRRARMRIHDRRMRCDPRSYRKELCSRHERRYRLCAG